MKKIRQIGLLVITSLLASYHPEAVGRCQTDQDVIGKKVLKNVIRVSALPGVSEHALKRLIKDFGKRHPDIDMPTWLVVSDGIVVKFSDNEVSYLVSYTIDGSWKHTIEHYRPNYIPPKVSLILNAKYVDYKILRSKKITSCDKAGESYIVQLQKDKRFKEVLVEGRSFTEISNMEAF